MVKLVHTIKDKPIKVSL